MKKKVLFVMESLGIGGAEKSLVTILSSLDQSKYDISLYLFRASGAFMHQIPEGINIIPISKVDALQKNLKTDWFTYLIHGYIRRSIYSLKWLISCCFSRYIKREKEYIGWENSVHLYSDIPNEYDIAIGFLEKKTTYFVVDHVKAKKKIAFMHTDYDTIPHNRKLDEKYFKQLDYLAVVSEHTRETMLKYFPFMERKIRVIKNIVSPELIYSMAQEKIMEMNVETSTVRLLTVGRLTNSKNIDGAIRVLAALRTLGVEAEWFVVGEGEERANLEKLIKDYGVEGYFHLLGAKSNPYPYMRCCDIYVQPSRWEGYGITVAEAKVLCKPIVVSSIPEFKEQIVDGITGVICDNEEEMVQGIMQIINNVEFREQLVENLQKYTYSSQEVKKLEALWEV